MALWGDKDSKGATGLVAITTNGVVTGTGTLFTTQAKVGNYITVSGRDYVITGITSNTAATVQSGVDGGSMTAVSPAAAYALSEKPVYVAKAESDGSEYGVHGNSTKVYGVDADEASVSSNADRGVNTPGWVRYTTYTDSAGNTRHKSEVLVAIKTITGDAADDAVAADLVITIDTQPEDVTIDSGDDVTFTVEASINDSVNSNLVLTYQWYNSDDEAIAGATGSTLTLENVTVEDSYYVIVSCGGVSVTSDSASITINP